MPTRNVWKHSDPASHYSGNDAGIGVDSDTGAIVYNDDGTKRTLLSAPNANTTGGSGVMSEAIKFDVGQGTAAGTYTGTIELPAGAVLHDINVVNTVLWDAGTSATLIVGDDDDDNGWFTGVDCKATDLVVGEVLSAMDDGTWGGVGGDYLTSAGRRGRTTAGVDSGPYLGAATEVIGVLTTVGTASTVGTTYLVVTYSVPTQTAATYAAS